MREQFIDKKFSKKSLDRLELVNMILDQYRGQGYDLSLRQLYYQLVARDYIENSQRSYKRLGNLVNDARLAGVVDWAMIADRGRSTDVNPHWENPGEIIESAARSFRRDKWENQPCHIEVMVEKDALSGVLWPVCSDLDIRFTANKGYPSASLLYSMSKRLLAAGRAEKKIFIIHLGDHDPSGIDMTRDLLERFELLTWDGLAFKVERLALNMDQVERYGPPENPAKVTDSRFKAYMVEFGESSWELDALEPAVLGDLVRDFVEDKIDQDKWHEESIIEKNMQADLREFADQYED